MSGSGGGDDRFAAAVERVRSLVAVVRETDGGDGLAAAVEALVGAAVARGAEAEARAAGADLERRRFQSLFDGVPDGYVITDCDGVIGEANLMAASLLGVPRRQLRGHSLADHIAEGDIGEFFTELAGLRSRSTTSTTTLDVVLGDEARFPAELHGVVEHHGSVDPRTVRWLVRDRRSDPTTTRLRTEEQQLRAVLRTVPVAVLLWDVTGEVLFVNDSARALLRPAPGAATIQEWLADLGPEEADALADAVAGLQAGEPDAHLSHRLRWDEERTRSVDHDIVEMRGEDGQVKGYVSTMVDLTRVRRTERHLQGAIEFTDAILDTVGALVAVVDAGGRLLRCNRTLEQVTGFGCGELVARSVVETLVPPDQQERFRAELGALLGSGEPRVFEAEVVTVSGQRRRISWSATVLGGGDGSVRGVICTGLDLTDQRGLEARLAQRARMESLGTVAAALAHDFNNTLTVLQARVERIAARHGDGATVSDVEALSRTIDRTGNLIGQLLTFSGTRRVAVSEPSEVGREVEQWASLVVDVLGAGIEVVLDLGSGEASALIDPSRLDQILTNLALNARDAMPAGGTLRVAVAVDQVRRGVASGGGSPHLGDGEYVRISVVDTGVGIEPHLLPRVFDPYVTTKPPSRGTGLGLASTYGMVIEAGGDIGISSRVGAGTTVTVWLPRLPVPIGGDGQGAAGSETTGPEAACRGGGGAVCPGGGPVLLVDDDGELLESLTDALRAVGFVVRGADGLTDAVGMAVEAPPAVLVTDVHLVDGDGVELAGALRARLPELPVVFMSGADVGGVVPPGSMVLAKPFPPGDLVDAVRRLASGSR